MRGPYEETVVLTFKAYRPNAAGSQNSFRISISMQKYLMYQNEILQAICPCYLSLENRQLFIVVKAGCIKKGTPSKIT